MFVVKRTIVIMRVKNYKNKFTFVEVIPEKCRLFSDTVYYMIILSLTTIRSVPLTTAGILFSKLMTDAIKV